MKLSFVFLCLSLTTLLLAAIPSAKEERSSLSSSKKGEKDGSASSTAGESSRVAKKKPVKSGKKMPKKRSGVGAIKGVKKTSAGEKSSTMSGSGKSSQGGSAVLSFFPKALVELIGEYLEGSFSVVFERSWSAARSSERVAVDSERYYLVAKQSVHASSHGDGKPMNIGNPDLSPYHDFTSSHDGRSLFLTGMTQEQASSDSLDLTARWLVQETGTKGLKSVTLESGEASFVGNRFMSSTNGKTLLSTLYDSILDTRTTSVYQIKEHGETASASKKADFDGRARAVSGDGNRILMECEEKWQLEIHDISRDESHLVLKIKYAGTTDVGSCALNSDGSKAAFIDDYRKLYIVDVGKEKSSISVNQLTPIDLLSSALGFRLIYDAEDRLHAFGDGNLWLVDSSKRELVSLEKAQAPHGHELQSWDVSPNVDYIALLIRSKDRNDKEEHQYQMVVKKDASHVLMHLCRH